MISLGITLPVDKRPQNVKAGIRIAHQKNYPFTVKCSNPEIGRFRMPLFINFVIDDENGVDHSHLYCIARELRLGKV